ncbi:CBS domain-containing protein [Marinobacter fonticola]|uniref:CBS domain-containing protein n=1 Tax=Marinobacter fonticola TaxID=2603215 RepID=UPI0011E73952|nr:CBS domain-containing protein [Marinobacter fonticola]
MNTSYHPLPTSEVLANPRIVDPDVHPELTPDDPAIAVMRDFREKPPETIGSDMPITEARTLMKLADAPLKLVTNRSEEFIGLIALKDILGKKALAQAHAMGTSLGDVQVKDIMARANQFPSVHMRHLANVRIGDVVETFNQAQTDHFLVFEDDENYPGRTRLRGLISSSLIARHLHIALESNARARSFSDIVHAVHGHFD